MMLFYSLCLSFALLLTAPVWLWRMARQGRYREGLRERLGGVPQRLHTGRPTIWIHCVSVGETLAAVRLVQDLEAALPNHAIVVSTTTPTGQQVARERFGADRVFFFPLDFAFAVRRYLRALQPSLVILMESELWPRMLVECERANIPVAVVNARVSDRSFPRYRRLQRLWQPLLAKLSLLLAQSDEDARRWRAIGAPAAIVRTAGNLKFDIGPPAETPLTTLVRSHLPVDARVFVCGSTHAVEEAILLDCWLAGKAQERVMILAPRHPQRAAGIATLCREHNHLSILLSHWSTSPTAIPADSILIVDTVGELASLYSLATVAFVGGSLIPHGGQNPLEPARLGVPVLMGPSHENFRDMVAAMREQNAIRMVGSNDLCDTLEHFLTVAENQQGERGRTFAHSMLGATERTVAALKALLREQTKFHEQAK